MISGSVGLDGIPTIILEAAGQEWTAIVDTGFNGDLELPESLRPQLNAQFVGRVSSLLAGGQRIDEDAYLVDFPFDGQTVRAQATFVAGNEILIGTRMLRRYRLEIDFPAGTVTIDAT